MGGKGRRKKRFRNGNEEGGKYFEGKGREEE